ncbi:MAG: hypothetical protein KAS23_00720 [Anaerohalosphaera sp.]|nr:hypothetical protein [Anaerohalosphaera sp.]
MSLFVPGLGSGEIDGSKSVLAVLVEPAGWALTTSVFVEDRVDRELRVTGRLDAGSIFVTRRGLLDVVILLELLILDDDLEVDGADRLVVVLTGAGSTLLIMRELFELLIVTELDDGAGTVRVEDLLDGYLVTVTPVVGRELLEDGAVRDERDGARSTGALEREEGLRTDLVGAGRGAGLAAGAGLGLGAGLAAGAVLGLGAGLAGAAFGGELGLAAGADDLELDDGGREDGLEDELREDCLGGGGGGGGVTTRPLPLFSVERGVFESTGCEKINSNTETAMITCIKLIVFF